MKTETITITWDEIGGIGRANRARIIRPSRGPDALGGTVTIEACGTAALQDGRSYRVICHRYAPRPLSGEKVTDSVQLLRDGRNLPESNLPAVRTAALRAFRNAYSMAGGCDWNTAAANWPRADESRPIAEVEGLPPVFDESVSNEALAATDAGKADAVPLPPVYSDSDLGPRPSADLVQEADAFGALAVLEYDCGAIYFPDDAAALRSWINDNGLTNPVFWTRPAVDMPLTQSALPVSKADAEKWAAPCDHEPACGNCERDLAACKADPCTMTYPVCRKCAADLPPETISEGPQFAGFIDIEMNWQSNVPLLLRLYTDGDAKGRGYAFDELIRLAKGVDERNARAKAGIVQEYGLKGDGCQAPGAIVLRHLASNEVTPFVVHFRNDQDSERTGKPVYYYGDYCATLADAWAAFADKVRRYDPTGTLGSN